MASACARPQWTCSEYFVLPFSEVLATLGSTTVPAEEIAVLSFLLAQVPADVANPTPAPWRVITKMAYFAGLIGTIGATMLHLLVLRPVLKRRSVDAADRAVLHRRTSLLLAVGRHLVPGRAVLPDRREGRPRQGGRNSLQPGTAAVVDLEVRHRARQEGGVDLDRRADADPVPALGRLGDRADAAVVTAAARAPDRDRAGRARPVLPRLPGHPAADRLRQGNARHARRPPAGPPARLRRLHVGRRDRGPRRAGDGAAPAHPGRRAPPGPSCGPGSARSRCAPSAAC